MSASHEKQTTVLALGCTPGWLSQSVDATSCGTQYSECGAACRWLLSVEHLCLLVQLSSTPSSWLQVLIQQIVQTGTTSMFCTRALCQCAPTSTTMYQSLMLCHMM